MDSKKFRIDLPEHEFKILLAALDYYESYVKHSSIYVDRAIYIERVSALYKYLDDDYSRKKRLRLQEEFDYNRKSLAL